jgi:hypothetical protein
MLLIYISYFHGNVDFEPREAESLFFIVCIAFIVGFLISMNVFFILGITHQRFIKKYNKLIPRLMLAVGALILSISLALLITLVSNSFTTTRLVSLFLVFYFPMLVSVFYQRWELRLLTKADRN